MALKQALDTRLAKRPPPQEPWRDADWQKLWLLIKARPWTSLAIVPAGPGAPPDFALSIAVTLAKIGIMHLGTPVHVADATRIPLGHLEQFSEEVRNLNSEGDLVLIALPHLENNAVAVALAQFATHALLCILLEEMSAASAKKTVDLVGAPHFVGSVVFDPDSLEQVKP